jgi:hypothetical protein
MVAPALLAVMLSGVLVFPTDAAPPDGPLGSPRSARLLLPDDDTADASPDAPVASPRLLDDAIQRLEASRPSNKLALVGLVLGSIITGGTFVTLLPSVLLFGLAGAYSGGSLMLGLDILCGALLLVGLPLLIAGAVVMRQMSNRNNEIDAEIEALEGPRQELDHPPGATAPELPAIPLSFSVTVARF